MAARSSLDPYGNADGLVDSYIGEAYKNVRLVAENMSSVSTLAIAIGNKDFDEIVADFVAAAASTAADVLQTAADRVATGQDRVQTGLDRADVATRQADVIVRQNDVITRQADVVAKQAQVALDAIATDEDRTQTGLDRVDVTTKLGQVTTIRDEALDIQEDLNTNFAEYGTRLTDLEDADTSQGGRLDTLETDSTAHDGRLTDLEGNDTTQDTRLVDLETNDGTQDGRLDTLETTSTSYGSRITIVEGIETTQNNRLGSLEVSRTNNESRIDNLETIEVNQDNRLTSIETLNTTQSGRLDGIDTLNTTQNGRLDALETNVVFHDGVIDVLQTEYGNHNTRLGALEESAVSDDGRLDSLESSRVGLTQIASGVDSFSELEAIPGRIVGMKALIRLPDPDAGIWEVQENNTWERIGDSQEQITTDAVQLVSSKQTYYPPQMPLDYTDTYVEVVNAVRNRYSGSELPPTNGAALTATNIDNVVASSEWSEKAWKNRREPSVVAVSADALAAGATGPRYAFYITLADLAAIDVVPDDVSPPLLSVRMIIDAAASINQTIDLAANNNGQMWVGLRYAGIGAPLVDTPISNTTDTVFTDSDLVGANQGPGNGDPIYASVTATRTLVDGEKRVTKGGIPIRATYGGQALTGLIIQFYGKATAIGPTKLVFGSVAVIKGSSIDINTEYKNGKEDYPEKDFQPEIDAAEERMMDYADALFGGAPTTGFATLVLNGDGFTPSYVESDLSGDTIRRTFTPFPTVTANLNAGGTGTPVVFNPNDDLVNGVLVRGSQDDATPDHIFDTTLSANHGYNKGNVTMTAHGKTTADIGSVWLNGGIQYIIVAINSSSVVAFTQRSGNGDVPSGTFTHVSGATNTANIVGTSVSKQQWYPPFQNRTIRTFIDDEETVSKTGTFQYTKNVRFVESYEVLSKAEMVAWREAAAKTDIQPTGRTPSYIVYNVYEYDRYGQLVIYVGRVSHGLPMSDIMGMQAAASGFGGGGTAAAQYYIRNTLEFAYGSGTLDYSMIEPVTAVIGGLGTTSANFTSEKIAATGPYVDSVVTLFDAGYVASMGWLAIEDVAEDVRRDLVSQLGLEIRGNTGKLYFRILDKGDYIAQPGEFYSAVGYRYIGPKPAVAGRTNAHPVLTSKGDRFYADWHDFAGIDTLTLPDEFVGREVVVENSKNAGLLGAPLGNELKVGVSADNGNAFLILRIEK